MRKGKAKQTQIYGSVLLVCVYNRHGNVITHDYFYQIFSQYGDVVKILIFEKAKVWKAFIQFTNAKSAETAMLNLNNRVVFEDGSKMNIFSSKLQNIKLQNSNVGGVNYEELRYEQTLSSNQQVTNRARRSTFDSFANNIEPTSFFSNTGTNDADSRASNQKQTSISCIDEQDTLPCVNNIGSFAFDIDQQFRQIALESEEFRQLEKNQNEEQNRKKSKTVVNNPNAEQFLLQNNPSKVLFIRSLPEDFNNQSLYNIFTNFGRITKIVYIKDKNSGLIEFKEMDQAITAKDQINYSKPEFKVFYSHYNSLLSRKVSGDEDIKQYNTNSIKNKCVNPPSKNLYFTSCSPKQEKQIREKCKKIGCQIKLFEWKENMKDRWGCLVEFYNIDCSLRAMAFLQGTQLKNGKELKISFTRSKIQHRNQKNYSPKSTHASSGKSSRVSNKLRYKEKDLEEVY